MKPQEPQVTSLENLIKLRNSSLELVSEMRKLTATLQNLKQSLNEYQEKVEEAQQLKQLQEEFKEITQSHQLAAEFREIVSKRNLN